MVFYFHSGRGDDGPCLHAGQAGNHADNDHGSPDPEKADPPHLIFNGPGRWDEGRVIYHGPNCSPISDVRPERLYALFSPVVNPWCSTFFTLLFTFTMC